MIFVISANNLHTQAVSWLADGRSFELREHSCDSGKEQMLFFKDAKD